MRKVEEDQKHPYMPITKIQQLLVFYHIFFTCMCIYVEIFLLTFYFDIISDLQKSFKNRTKNGLYSLPRFSKH